MTTLTKVFVVLHVLFSIAFTVMTVSVVSQTANWKDTAEKYRGNAHVADTNLRNLMASNATVLAAANDRVRMHRAEITGIQGKLDDSQGEVRELTLSLATAESEKSSASAMNRGLIAQLQVAEAARAEFRKQRDELEYKSIDLQTRNIDLNDRVNEQTARIVVLNEQKRQFEQQLNILRDENQQLAMAARRSAIGQTMEAPTGASMSRVTALTPVVPTPVRGMVLEMAGKLLTISVGAADGVKKDMIFVIHRDGQYIGDLQISLVDPDRSAGRIVRSTFAPRLGDHVTNESGLAVSQR